MKNTSYKLTALLWEIKWRGRFLRCFHGSTWKNDCLLANAGPTILECVVLKCCDRLAAAYQEPLPINMENPTTGRKIWIFLYCVKKNILVNYFSEMYFQTSSEFTFLWNLGKFEILLNQPKWSMEFMQNCIFSAGQYRKKRACLDLETRNLIYVSGRS